MDESQQKEWEALQTMVDAVLGEVGSDMKARLYQKMQEGYTGWDNTSPDNVKGLLRRIYSGVDVIDSEITYTNAQGSYDSPKLKIIDVINRLAMVYNILNKLEAAKGGELSTDDGSA